MDTTNGLLNDSHNNMANTLKEMLKISSPSDTTVGLEAVNHNGAGDANASMTSPAIVEIEAYDESEQNTPASLTSGPNKNKTYQSISLEKVEDGECVQIVGEETHITSSSKTETDSLVPASNKVKINTITKFEWEQRYYTGSLVSVTNTYMAYSIKGRGHYSVRVINRHNSSDRVLLKGFTGIVSDVAFAHANSNLLAAVDSVGNLIIWSLDQIDDSIVPEKKLHVMAEEGMEKDSATHRVAWIPTVQTDDTVDEDDDSSKSESSTPKILALAYNNTAEVWDLDLAFPVADNLEDAVVRRSDVGVAFTTVKGHSDEISDCELSPIGNVLATASYDGFVKFWQVQIEDTESPCCLHQFKPYDDGPVSAVKFCDNKKQSELSVYWRFLLTGSDRNSVLKLWCTVTWNCLQVVKFEPTTQAHALPEMNIILHLSADFLVLSDIRRKVLYVMQCKTNINDGNAQIFSIAQFQLASPLLSMAFIDAKHCKFKSDSAIESGVVTKGNSGSDSDSDEDDTHVKGNHAEDDKLDGVLVKLMTIQARSLQSLDVRFIPCESTQNDTNSGSTYNTISDDIKDQVSLGSMDDAMSPSSGGKAPNDELDFLTSGSGGVLTPKHSDTSFGEIDTKSADDEDLTQDGANQTNSGEELAVDQNIPENHVSPEQNGPSPDDDTTIAPDVTRSTSPPVLLTPEAFMGTHKSPGTGVDSINTSFTAVTPFSTIGSTFYQSNQDSSILLGVRNSLPNYTLSPSSTGAEAQEQAEDHTVKTPPSSPILPRASSSPPAIQAPAAAAEILQSFCSRSVKSPDLISSTSTQDEAKHESSTPIVPPSSALSGRTYTAGPSSMADSQDPFPLVLIPVTSSSVASGSAWPKAPDVTMSRPLQARSPPASGPPSLVSQHSRSDQSDRLADAPVDSSSNHEQPVSQSVAANNDHVIKLINDFQEHQETMLTEHQRELEAISKKQSNMQKHTDSVLKRSEQQGERLEKAVKSLSDNQRRFSADIKTIQSGASDAAGSKIDRVIKSEMKRTVLPTVTQNLDAIKDQFNTTVAQQLTATDTVLKETIGNLVKSKDIVDTIAVSTAKAIHEQVRGSLPEIFFNTLIPSFERSCQTMFQQLSATYHRGMEETVNKLEKQMQFRMKPEQDRFQALIKDAGDTATQLQAVAKVAQTDLTTNIKKQFTESIEKTLTSFEDRITANVLQAIKLQQEKDFAEQRRAISELVRDVVARTLDEKMPQMAGVDASAMTASPVAGGKIMPRTLLQRPSIVDQQQHILKMLQQGNVNTAFQTALTAADLNLVMYVCETVDPSVVFGVTPCPLQQPILLSLIQQLSSDLTTKTEVKLKYLQEAVMNLDRRHQITQEYMHSVLSALVQKLQSCSQGPLENPSLAKDLKMLAMAAQSLMK